MKFTIIILLVTFLQSSAEVYSQRITLSKQNAPLEEVVKSIMRQTDYQFIYSTDVLRKTKPVDIELKNALLTEALDLCFKGQDITYVINNKTVIIKQSDTRTVTGKVTNQKGESLPGVNVLIKGTYKGTVTDIDGNYSIEVKPNETVLVFSYIGMKSQEVAISGDKLVINVVLTEEVAKLDELVVTGYQTISRERVAGATSRISSNQWQDKRMSSLNSLVEGKVAGFNNGQIRGITTMNGNSTPLYVIDGFPVENTRYNEYGSLEESVPELNIEDIESITVLKDAAATSIYGARAANGVVVIVTKKAQKGKLAVSFSNSVTTSQNSLYTGNLADAATMIGLESEWARTNPNLTAGVGDSLVTAYAQNYLDNAIYYSAGMKSLLNYYAGNIDEAELNQALSTLAGQGYKYINDLEKYGKRSNLLQQYNIGLTRGSDNNYFKASFSYRNNQLEDKYSGNQSYGININNITDITKWLQLDLGTYTYIGNGTTQTYSLLSPGYNYMIYESLADRDGNFYTSEANSRYSLNDRNILSEYNLYNMDITPLREVEMNKRLNKDFSNRTHARLNIRFTDWLKYSAAFQYEQGQNNISQLNDMNSFYVREKVNTFASVDYNTGSVSYLIPYGNIYYTNTNSTTAYNFRQQLDYNKTVAEGHDLTAIAGFETRDNKVIFNSQTLYNYDDEILSYSPINANDLVSYNYSGVWGWGSFSKYDIADQREIVNRYVSLYGNAAYTYVKKYTLTGSLRWDRSNLWGTNSKYQKKPTWSVGGVWNISNESFFTSNLIDMLRLRLSYGIGGNIAKNAAPYMTAGYSINPNVGGNQGYIIGRPNPLLSWEQTKTSNIGLDFFLLDNRLHGSVDLYHKKGVDLLANTMGVPTEGFGYSTYQINNGEMTNRGIELNIGGEVIRSDDFTLSATGIFAYNKNEVTYVNVEAPVYFLQLDYPEEYPRIGNPYNAIYGYKWAGLSETGLPQIYDHEGSKVSIQPQELTDIVYLGTHIPVYNGSLNINADYKRWSLSMLFVYEGGHKVRNTFLPFLNNAYSSAAAGYITTFGGLISADIADRWQKPGDELITDIPRAIFGEDPEFSADLRSIYAMSDINVLDATNVRLSNISLNYRVPSELCQKLHLKDTRLQFNVENAFMFAKSPQAKYMLNGFIKPSYVFGLYFNF